MEVAGFWIGFAGWLLLLVSSSHRIEKYVPGYVQVILPAFAVLLMMIGGHLWCLGNQGRYPGYPLDLLMEWFG